MNVVGDSSSNDFAHYLMLYIPCNVEKFHSYQRIAVAGLGGGEKKAILCYQFKNGVLKQAASPDLIRLQRCSIHLVLHKDKEEKCC